MIKLKPCPFCGKEVDIDSYDPFDGYQGDCMLYKIWCDCGARLENRSKEQLIMIWNRREEQ